MARRNWLDGVGGGTPIDAAGLNNIEERIESALARLATLEASGTTTTTPSGVTPIAYTPGVSTPARWQINYGGAPIARALYTTGVNSDGKAQVAWVGSFPDTRARSSRMETGVAAQPQNGYQAWIVDTTNSTTVADSGVATGTVETWVATAFTPVAGRVYTGNIKVRSTDGQWSATATTRFVAPTGVVRYFEDFGAVGDGVANDGGTSGNNWTGPVRAAIAASNPGDIVRSKKPGTVLTSIASSGTSLTSSAAVFTSAMVGKKVMVYGGGVKDSSGSAYVWRTTISAVAADGKSATLASAVLTAQTAARVVVGYPQYLIGHTDIDAGMGGTNAARGGVIVDGAGCLFTSNEVDFAGFRTTLPNMTYQDVHYWSTASFTRGNGLNNNTGPFFTEGTGAVGIRFLNCYAEHARDAGFLIYGGPSDIHVVDCTTDHCMADPFHVTGSANNIQFIRPTAVWAGDDVVANIGYRSDGDAARPYNITWENPRMLGQDWGRGLSFGGSRDCLATDVVFEGGAMASFIIGSDGDMANTDHVQIRRFAITNPHARYNQKPTYTQGAATTSTITDGAWLKLLNSGSATPQRNILIEDGTVSDGWQIQIISYGGGTFADQTVTIRGVTMTGATNAGTGWADDGTYPGHIDLRGISVPAGSTPAAAPASPNTLT